jgi:hypothetical protein
MKSPWQIGLVAIALTGVSAYDYLYFTKRNDKKPAAEIKVSSPVSGPVEPLLAPLPEPVEEENAMDGGGSGDLRPPISLDELQAQSRQALILKEQTESVSPRSEQNALPGRLISPKPVRRIASISKIKESSIAKPIPAPQCVFSGTLIEGRKKRALVNGMPLTIGDRLGVWTLVQIEPDHIVWASGSETHRMKLKSVELLSVHRKDPL